MVNFAYSVHAFIKRMIKGRFNENSTNMDYFACPAIQHVGAGRR
jgi:hypothetical protein